MNRPSVTELSTVGVHWCPSRLWDSDSVGATLRGNICWDDVLKLRTLWKKCPSTTHRMGCLIHFSEPCPRKGIGALLMTSQRCSPADGRGGQAASSQGSTLQLNEALHLGLWTAGKVQMNASPPPLVSTADSPFQDLRIECVTPAWPRFSLLVAISVFESAGGKTGKCTTAKQRKTRTPSPFVSLGCR